MPDRPPVTAIIGVASAQWPVRVFPDETQAVYWYETTDGMAGQKRLFRVNIEVVEELRVVRSDARLVPVDDKE